ncbi:hypothetical protein C9J40_20050 [Photobacterium sp. GB-72]|nr:hypothetical protein C9J40_20050 [Photobacterium sp. GB-72]
MVDLNTLANNIRRNNNSVDAQIIAISRSIDLYGLSDSQATELSQLIDDDAYVVWNDQKLRAIAQGVFPSFMTLKKMQRLSQKRLDAIITREVQTEAFDKLCALLDEIGIAIVPVDTHIGFFLVDIEQTYCKFIESQHLQQRAAIAFSLINLSFDIAKSKNLLLQEYKEHHTTLVANNYSDVLNYAGCRLNMNSADINANYWLLTKIINKNTRLELARIITEYTDAS